MSYLEMKNVSVSFGSGQEKTEVLSNINLTIEKDEFIAIVGFSGSGKSTLINLFAGLIKPTEGQVLYKGKEIQGPDPERGIVFQNYSLLPWLTVFSNVELAVKNVFPKLSKAERREKVDSYLKMVSLYPARHKRPHELSGGMRQRVSVARTLAMSPDVLLLDEPLSALDALTRSSLQDEIENIWERDKKTVVLITNDVDEGMLLADRIVPLNPGPKATLGPTFPVTLKRPRDRKEINHSPMFKKIRNEINTYLTNVNSESNQKQKKEDLVLPDLEPVELNARDYSKAVGWAKDIRHKYLKKNKTQKDS